MASLLKFTNSPKPWKLVQARLVRQIGGEFFLPILEDLLLNKSSISANRRLREMSEDPTSFRCPQCGDINETDFICDSDRIPLALFQVKETRIYR